MNADLEETVNELGSDATAVVARLRAARTVEPSGARVFTPPRRALLPRVFAWSSAALVAATLAGVCLVSRVALEETASPDAAAPVVRSAEAASDTPYTLALTASPATIAELIRTQAADGSWANDYLTQQNAAALRGVSEAGVAYRKAVRYLRTKGLTPLSEREFAERVSRARVFPAVS